MQEVSGIAPVSEGTAHPLQVFSPIRGFSEILQQKPTSYSCLDAIHGICSNPNK
jgi:hypothetical protein